MSETFDIEQCLLELIQTNVIIKSVSGHTFQLMTLTNSIREDLEHVDNVDDLLKEAANYALCVKVGDSEEPDFKRAIEFDGMTDQKFKTFWANERFESNEDNESAQLQFGKIVLEESDMSDMITNLTPEEEEPEISVEALVSDANDYQHNVN